MTEVGGLGYSGERGLNGFKRQGGGKVMAWTEWGRIEESGYGE